MLCITRPHIIGLRGEIMRTVRSAATSCALVVIGVGASHAQCIPYEQRTPQTELQAFVIEPTAVLRELRNDNRKIEPRLAGYLATDPTLLPSVRRLIADAPSVNRPAIGAALRMAQTECTDRQPDAARKIFEFVHDLGDKAVLSGYVAVAERFLPPQDAQPAAPLGTSPKPPVNNSLMTGEWNLDPVDPFAEIPAPLTILPIDPQ